MELALATLAIMLAIKHFLADGLYQTAWHYKNKGTFLHLGGLSHSLNHAFGTFVVLLIFGILFGGLSKTLFIGLVLFDFFTHYIIDYGKMNLTKNKGYSAMGTCPEGRPCQMIFDNKFYVWLVADQCAHFSVYGLIIAAIASTL